MAEIPLSFRLIRLNQHCHFAVPSVQKADGARAHSGKQAPNHPEFTEATCLVLHYECVHAITCYWRRSTAWLSPAFSQRLSISVLSAHLQGYVQWRSVCLDGLVSFASSLWLHVTSATQ